MWTYRLLVPHHKYPAWKLQSTRGIAYHSHLYTKVLGGDESDKFERWLASDFEAPALKPFEKAIADAPLSLEDWSCLIKFIAAQDVRTPARLEQQMKRWQKELPQLMAETLKEGSAEYDRLKKTGKPIPKVVPDYSKDCPIDVSIVDALPGELGKRIKAEVTIGRGFWLWNMRLLLEKTIRVLHQHRWTVLVSPKDVLWPTSDDPVVRLNFRSISDFDFEGGWGSVGSEIFLPIGPRHLLYTEIGQRSPFYKGKLSRDQASLIKRLLIEHGHRMLFASQPDSDVSLFRPRTEDAVLCEKEKVYWARWHEEQAKEEAKAPRG